MNTEINDIDARLGLEPDAKYLIKTFDPAGSVDLRDVERVFGEPCDVILVAVPIGEGLTFQTALAHELSREEVGPCTCVECQIRDLAA